MSPFRDFCEASEAQRDSTYLYLRSYICKNS